MSNSKNSSKKTTTKYNPLTGINEKIRKKLKRLNLIKLKRKVIQ